MEGRMDAIIVYRKILMQLLNEGFNPFEDNTDSLLLIEKHIKKPTGITNIFQPLI